jgi:hypothetical protein
MLEPLKVRGQPLLNQRWDCASLIENDLRILHCSPRHKKYVKGVLFLNEN